MKQNEQNVEQKYEDYGVGSLVPDEARHYSFFDMFSTWVGANCQPNTWFVGGCLAASGLGVCLGVNLTAVPILFLIVALVGYIGFRIPTTAMGVARFSFGINGSRILSLMHVISQFGWAASNAYVGATSLKLMFNTMGLYMEDRLLLALCIAIVSGLTAVLVAFGGSKTLKVAENVGVIVMVVLSFVICFAVFKNFTLSDLMAWEPPDNVRLSFGEGADQIASYSFGWIICVVEFTRYTKTKSSATVAPMLGSWFGVSLFAMIGAIGVIGAALTTGVFDQNASDPSSVAAALGLGIPAFIVILFSIVTTTVVGQFCCCSSAVNLFNDRITPKKMQPIISICCFIASYVPMAFPNFLSFFYVFMDFLGAVFPPIGAIMIVDYYLIRKGKYQPEALFDKNGPYYYKGGFNPLAWIAFILGAGCFIGFKYIPGLLTTTGALFPAFFVTALVYYIFARIGVKTGLYRDVEKIK